VGTETLLSTRCKRSYANAHTYHINSIALSSDCETFISADDLRVNLWHLDRQDQAFNIVDIKPQSMEDLTEVITCADFHPRQCNLFAYSSSKGLIRLADMRQAALCDQHSKLFEDSEPSVRRRRAVRQPTCSERPVAARLSGAAATRPGVPMRRAALLRFLPQQPWPHSMRTPFTTRSRAPAPSSPRSSLPSTTSGSAPAAATSSLATT
jgi:WD40 repeat protein